MDSVVKAIYRKKKFEEDHRSDAMIWNEDDGFLVSTSQFVNGQAFWAVVEGVDGPVEVRYSQVMDDVVMLAEFSEIEKKRKKARYKPWEMIKSAILRLYQGHKPDYVSWNEAKRELRRRELETNIREENGWSLMSMRTGARAIH